MEKAINLAKKTEDKVIVVDEFNDSSLVIISLAEYERLMQEKSFNNPENIDIKSLTEEELLDKINRDIVMWQDRNRDKELGSFKDDFSDLEEDNGKDEDENMYYYDEMSKMPNKEQVSEIDNKEDHKSWHISNEVKDRAQEID